MEPDRVRQSEDSADRPTVYAVSIRGRLGAGLIEAFSPLVASTGTDCTTLTGPIEDQAALYGVLAKIQNFGLELDELRRLLPTSA